MSTRIYLECRTHKLPIRSDGEVGNTVSDVEFVFKLLAQRYSLTIVHKLTNEDMGYQTGIGGYTGAAAYFLAQHPDCEIAVVDEYGDTHTPEETPEKETNNG